MWNCNFFQLIDVNWMMQVNFFLEDCDYLTEHFYWELKLAYILNVFQNRNWRDF